MAKQAQLIRYQKDGEWSGYSLKQREDGLWIYEQWAAIQGCASGRRVVIREPEGMDIKDEADLDTLYTNGMSKAEYLKIHGVEVRCLHRGYMVN